MSDPKLISPLLDGFTFGAAMSSHDGISCHPAIKENTDTKYIVKKVSIPASQVQLDALLLTGAYKDPADATEYFREQADKIVKEAEFLQKLGRLDGFLPFEGWQVVPMEDGKLGYEIYLVSTYKRSLAKYMRKNAMTHLEAVNLSLDLCQALAICRRAGHMYVDLKPTNIFISKGKEYRIGDLGFVDLEGLKYSSLPGKYRSPYSPPEALDDLKTLNKTVDTYAVGMILYQIYNDGKLPLPPIEPNDPFPSPAYADYEIAEIIMKAIAPKVDQRWTDPMEMGQALIAYMQRNSINNTPIVPPRDTEEEEPVIEETAPVAAEPASEAVEAVEADDSAESGEAAEETTEPDMAENSEEPPAEEAAEPVIRIELPETKPLEEDDDDFSFLFAGELEEEPEEQEAEPEVKPSAPERKPRKTGWILPVVLILLLALLGFGGFWFYQNHYLQTIDALTVDGTQDKLIVTINTQTDHSLLTVVCTDTYGNATRQTPENGQTVFSGLLPNSQYKIQLEISGFHKLVGQTTDMFNTEAQTSIVSLSAITGAEDGSVMLNFTVEGSEPEEWTVTYVAEGEEEKSHSFTGHNVTIRGLTVGKTYTFTLDSSEELPLLGQTTLQSMAASLVLARDLTITGIVDGNMTVQWRNPEDLTVPRWDVRCYGDGGYEQTMSTDAATEAVFTGIDPTKSYTVEVTAIGMTQPVRASITANPITVTGLNVNEEDPEQLTVSWDFEGDAPEGGWLLLYSLDNNSAQSVIKCSEASGVISPRIHGAKYRFEIQAVDGTSVFGSIQTYACPNPQIFDEHSLPADKITAHLLKTPEKENWSYKDITKNDYTSQFASGDKISLILHAGCNFYIPEDEVRLMYVFRNGEGNVIPELITHDQRIWKAMWINDDYHYCELDLSAVPTQPGDYSLSLYFNGDAVMVITFSITA